MDILIADDHAMFRDGLRHLLNALDNIVNIIEAATCDETVDMASANILNWTWCYSTLRWAKRTG